MKKHLITAAALLLLTLPGFAVACEAGAGKAGSCPVAAHGSHYGSHCGSHHGGQGHNAMPGTSPGHIRMILKEADRIGLSGKQRQQIGGLLIEAESGVARAHAEAEVAVANFRSRLHSGSVTDKEVDAYTTKIGELRTTSIAANLKASVAAMRLLSDEQKRALYGRGAK